MSRKQYKDLTEQEILKIVSRLLHTVDEDKDIAEDHNASTRVVRRIADEYGINIDQRRNAIFLRKQYVWHFKEGSRIRYEAESQFRESVAQGLRKFWVEDQNLGDMARCPACGDHQRPCKCGLL